MTDPVFHLTATSNPLTFTVFGPEGKRMYTEAEVRQAIGVALQEAAAWVDPTKSDDFPTVDEVMQNFMKFIVYCPVCGYITPEQQARCVYSKCGREEV